MSDCRKRADKLSAREKKSCEHLAERRTAARLSLALGKFLLLSDVKIDTSERMVLCGAVNDRFFMARFNPDGTPDRSFNRNGKLILQHRDDRKGECRSFAIDAQNNYLATGGSGKIGEEQRRILRINTNGSVDTMYSGTAMDAPPWPGVENFFGRIAMTQTGSVAVGHVGTSPGNSECYLTFLDAKGLPNTGMANSGRVRLPFLPNHDCVPQDLLVDSQQRIIIVYYLANNENQKMYVLRVKASGETDAEFGNNGHFEYTVPGQGQVGYCNAALDKQDNLVMLVGDNRFCQSAKNGQLIRLQAANGTPDPTFPDYLGAAHRMYPKGFAFDAAGNFYISVGGIGGGMTLTTVSLTPDGRLRTDWGRKAPRP